MEISMHLKSLFENEIDNYRTAVRNGDIDPSDGFHPTLYGAVDSLLQAPQDIVFAWLGIEGDEDDDPEVRADALQSLADSYLQLANLICVLGPEAKLVSLT